MSNFAFLQTGWPEMCREAREAEQHALTSPKACVILCRSALEKGVRWLYDHDSDLHLPYDTKLSTLIHEQCFRDILRPSIFREINLIRRYGNSGAHGEAVSQEASLAAIKFLFRFLSFIAAFYGEGRIAIPPFDENLLPDGKEQERTRAELEKLAEALAASNEAAQAKQKRMAEQAALIAVLQEQLAAQKQAGNQRREAREKDVDVDTVVPLLVSEATTRRLYIDALLKEAGWDGFQRGRDLEYEVNDMPRTTNPSGKGFVDYVLWGKDGKPLAVVEAKKTMASARKGRHQAELYADCLEKTHGQRPVIFYTNGFETCIWDDTFYTDREVDGFYTQDELQLLVDRRQTRKDLRMFAVDRTIAGRPYQLEAIQRVAENLVVTGKDGRLRGAGRASLLVMATGSGKTRTAIAIVDMLTKCNWAKRVLFLADRNALVTQAKNRFNEHLPELSAIDLTKNREDEGTRLVFSTYPTIINKIDRVKTEDQRFYGVGHFDLIIIDEAHRSVYQKYRAIFEYFDALLIGLTATPKDDIDRNTYGLFGIEDHQPTFGYELDDAVAQGYLVPPRSISVPLKFQREGIKYAELSEAEKIEYEEKFGDPTTEEIPDAIGSDALNKWLFNADTVDKVLAHVMENGLKVAGGDMLGKTIVFAKNHKHAVFIEARFNKNYPEYGGTFLRVIDNYETKAEDLLEKFVDDKTPQEPYIAVSVDMMDTGVDAPMVLNLVFFKVVRSATKFWQMIGRGTRLCPDLFGPGENKTEFLIFDFCENLDFFDAQPEGIKTRQAKPLLQQVFQAKLRVAQLVAGLDEPTEAEAAVRAAYLEALHKSIATLDKDRFVVRKQLRHVEAYSDKNKWQHLSKGDVQEIHTHLSHLEPAARNDDELARRFDLLVLNGQIRLLTGTGDFNTIAQTISQTARDLQKKDNIPPIAAQLPLIKTVQTDSFWQTIDIRQLDDVRQAFRALIKYLDKERQAPVYTHFEDELDLDNVKVREPVKPIMLKPYKERVENYIRQHQHHLVIHKLRHNIPITRFELDELEQMLFREDVAESKEAFAQQYGEKPLGAFIREITGLEKAAVQEAFAAFLQVGHLQADQMRFVQTIIDYLTTNGVIEADRLFEPPFTDLNDQGLTGVFRDEAAARKIVGIISGINQNAAA